MAPILILFEDRRHFICFLYATVISVRRGPRAGKHDRPHCAGTLALGMQAWPDATTHQLMQSLARNTRGGNPNLDHNTETGYGVIDPLTFVAANPCLYPHEPPFMEKELFDDKYCGGFDMLDGLLRNNQVGDAEGYQEDAGIDPDIVEWVPAELESMVGTAREADYWENDGATSAPTGDEHLTKSPEPGASTSDADPSAAAVASGADWQATYEPAAVQPAKSIQPAESAVLPTAVPEPAVRWATSAGPAGSAPAAPAAAEPAGSKSAESPSVSA